VAYVVARPPLGCHLPFLYSKAMTKMISWRVAIELHLSSLPASVSAMRILKIVEGDSGSV
jgi:hypothetical protein